MKALTYEEVQTEWSVAPRTRGWCLFFCDHEVFSLVCGDALAISYFDSEEDAWHAKERAEAMVKRSIASGSLELTKRFEMPRDWWIYIGIALFFAFVVLILGWN